MLSRISIDVDYDNKPIIKIEYEDSPDVRDKLVKNFLQAFGGSSCYATFFYDDSLWTRDQDKHKAIIRPIHPHDLLEQSKTMALEGQRQDAMANHLKETFPSETTTK